MNKLSDIYSWFSRRTDPYLLLLICLSLFALVPLLSPGYFYSAHDGRHSVFYLAMFDAAIQDGALWPRWAMHHIQGYGYPTFIIQAPLGFYLAEIFVLLGAGYTVAVKWAWAVGFMMSGWGIYQLVFHWLTQNSTIKKAHSSANLNNIRLAAVVAGLLYVYLPYHLTGIYVRAAINDTTLFAWYPWVILAFDRLIIQGMALGWQRRAAIALFCLAGTLLTHTFALISFAPFLMLFVLFRLITWTIYEEDGRSRWQRFYTGSLLTGGAGIGALLLCANFLLPLLVEGQHLEQQVYVTDTYDFRNHFVYWGQFFSPFWGYGFSDDPTGVNDGMGFQLGLMALIMMIYAISTVYQAWNSSVSRQPPNFLALTIYLILAMVVLLWLMTPTSTWLWEAMPVLAIIQFPWRLLALAAFTVSALSGLTIWILFAEADEQNPMALLLICLVVILASWPYIDTELQAVEPWREDGRAVYRFEREHPDMIAYTEWVQEPFTQSPMTADYEAENYQEKAGKIESLTRFGLTDGKGEMLTQMSRGASAEATVRVDSDSAVLQIHLYYFPGWQVRVDGDVVDHRVSNPHGLMEVDLLRGQHHVIVSMEATPIRQLGMVLSSLTLGLALWFIRKRGPNTDYVQNI